MSSQEPAAIEAPGNVVRLAAVPSAPTHVIEVGELPQQVNLTIYQGTTFQVKITVTQDGEPADLSGMACDAQIRSRPADERVMAEFDVTVEENVLYLALSGEQTAELSARGGAWDVRLQAEDYTTVIVRGRVKVTERVTR